MTSTEEELKALMLRGLDGDGPAHAALLSALAGYMRAYFGRRLGPGAAETEDLVQETLLAIHLKRDTYDRRQLFTPWAYAIARYKLLDHFRRTGRRKQVPLENAAELTSHDDPQEGATRVDLERLLAALPERAQKLMFDIKLKGLSLEEAAEKHEMTVGSVKVAIHRALKQLKEKVADEDR